jgi:hypothetical protein
MEKAFELYNQFVQNINPTYVSMSIALVMSFLLGFVFRDGFGGNERRTGEMSRKQKVFVRELCLRLSDEIVEILEDARCKGQVPGAELAKRYKALANALNLWDLVPKHVPDKTPHPEDLKEAIRKRLRKDTDNDPDIDLMLMKSHVM